MSQKKQHTETVNKMSGDFRIKLLIVCGFRSS